MIDEKTNRSLDSVFQAITISTDAHKGQFDKADAPYIEHPLRVALLVSTAFPGDIDAYIVAVLHDVVEDQEDKYPLKKLSAVFPSHIIKSIDAITKRKDEPHDKYLDRVSKDYTALIVKIMDIMDNLDENRLALLTLETQGRLRKKYNEATNKLMKTWEETYNGRLHRQI